MMMIIGESRRSLKFYFIIINGHDFLHMTKHTYIIYIYIYLE
jgi:hypothetical protein